MYKIAIAGASSLLGRELKECLSESPLASATFALVDEEEAQGQIDQAFAMQQEDKPYSMVMMQVTLRNIGEKPLFVKEIKASIVTDQGESTDDAASAVDYGRYLQAFPDLQMYASEPLKVETKIPPGGETKGSVLVAFPITKDQFYARKDLTVTVFPYDQRPIVLHEKGATPAK